MIETKRLIFRPWKESDAEELFLHASDPDVGPRAGWPPHTSVEQSLEIINTVFNSDHIWALVLKDSNRLIGCMGYYDHSESNIGINEGEAEVGDSPVDDVAGGAEKSAVGVGRCSSDLIGKKGVAPLFH